MEFCSPQWAAASPGSASILKPFGEAKRWKSQDISQLAKNGHIKGELSWLAAANINPFREFPQNLVTSKNSLYLQNDPFYMNSGNLVIFIKVSFY